MNKPAIELRHLNVLYGSSAVLWDVSLTIPRGELVGIIGPNGAGKSTLLKSLCRLVPISSGQIHFDDRVKDKIAYVPQRSLVDWTFPMSAFELVEMGLFARSVKLSSRERRDKVHQMVEMVGMKEYAHCQIGELSGGQQQRLFIGRALLQEAELFLLDEVFNGIDALTEEFLLDLFKKMCKEGKTILIVHHDLTTVERDFSWVAMLNVRLVAAGPTRAVFTKDLLAKTYGKAPAFLGEGLRLSEGGLGG